ncbi:MAG: hypothetical protein JST10_04825 [Bacteroidetes bacterium]|nr:hypothetical protein [Bacteroidota bacterium]MBS1631878.1 hypothetical protein [Bacteroidota bacterium]
MEVHAHSHTHTKKTWKEYFWEFLMLFLAVFCGFLAEYQLEHVIERQREKKYIQSLVNDLMVDTSFVNNELKKVHVASKGLDTLIKNLYSDSAFYKVVDIYRQQATYNALLTPEFADQTITQLLSSGNMRLIKDQQIARLISDYWSEINNILKIAERSEERINRSMEISIRLFNRNYVKFPKDKDGQYQNPVVDPHAMFMTKDRNEIIAYANWIERARGLLKDDYPKSLQQLKQKATKLIESVKKEYHLE